MDSPLPTSMAGTAPSAVPHTGGQCYPPPPPPQQGGSGGYHHSLQLGAGEGRPDTARLLQNEADLPRNDETIPVYGPLAAAASSYRYTKQYDAGTLRVEYASRSRLSKMCSTSAHEAMVMVWDEFFWILSLPLLVLSTFFNALLRFLLEGVVRPLVLGPIQLLGDHLCKPLSVVQFDALVLPAVTLLANTLGALLLLVRPASQLLELLVRPLATLLSACCTVRINYGLQPPQLAATHPAKMV